MQTWRITLLPGLGGPPRAPAPPLFFFKGKTASNPCFYEMGITHHKFVELSGGKPFCVPKDLAVS